MGHYNGLHSYTVHLAACYHVSVEVRLQAAGDAPIMKQKNYKVDGDKKIEWILTFIRKYLKIQDSEHLV